MREAEGAREGGVGCTIRQRSERAMSGAPRRLIPAQVVLFRVHGVM